MIGARLREARLTRRFSLNAVAEKADISVATLSRIERDQQRIDVDLLLALMRILKLEAREVFQEEPREESGVEPMAAQISALPAAERTKLWRSLATARKANQRESLRTVAQRMDEFLAQIDFLRTEIEAVKKKLR